METAISLSCKIAVTSTNIVKFFIPRVLYDPRVAIRHSAKIVKFFLPTRVVNLSVECLKYLSFLSSFLSIVEQVQVLEQQIRELQKNSLENQHKFTKARFVNISLNARIVLLEEEIKEIECKYEERLQELLTESKYQEQEKQLQLEDANKRLQEYELHSAEREEELARQKKIINRLENDRKQLMKQVENLAEEMILTRNEVTISKEQERRSSEMSEMKSQVIEKLLNDLEKLRSDVITPLSSSTPNDSVNLEELYHELYLLKEKNLILEDTNEELQTSLLLAGIKQGQFLTTQENKYATDMEVMSKEEIHKALKDEQGINAQLKTYIDGILLKIVENYPQLLEVKQMSKSKKI